MGATDTSGLVKAPTGISGLDEITHGGLPAGRGTLVCGGPGCGKTVLAMEFLVQGVRRYGEPALFLSFEESTEDLLENFDSMGFALRSLVSSGKLRLSHVALSEAGVFEAGEFSLDGLLVMLDQALSATGMKRVVLDSLDALFAHLSNRDILRAELARLLRFLRQRRVTSLVTAERGGSGLTRYDLEEYVYDCVLALDHRVDANIAKRRLRIIKYRGSHHGVDEYPFVIGANGVSVFPITSVTPADVASTERVSSGVSDLDEMLGLQGYYRGSDVLVSGTSGTGKTTLAAAFANATCERGERCLFLTLEESQSQIVRNMRLVGIDLGRWVSEARLTVKALRATSYGLEEHLVTTLRAIEALEPSAVVIDPITNFVSVGGAAEVKSMLVRLFDHLRARGITTLATHLSSKPDPMEDPDVEVSSLMDTWIVTRHRIEGNRRTRLLYVAKSRGMESAQDVRELILSSTGVSLRAIIDDDKS